MHELTLMEDPYKNLSFKERIESVIKIGKENREEFNKNLDRVTKKVEQVDPFLLMSWLVFQCLFHNGVDFNEEEMPALQYHIEIIQGIILTVDDWSRANNLMVSGIGHEIIDSIKNAGNNFGLMRLSQTSMEISISKTNFLLEQIRTQTTAIRNWTYPMLALKTVYEILEPVDKKLFDKKGLKIKNVFQTIQKMIETMEDRANEHIQLISKWYKSESIEELAELYLQTYPKQQISRKEIIIALSKFNNMEKAKAMLLCKTDLSLVDIFRFTNEDIKFLVGNDDIFEAVKNCFEDLTYQLGDLSDFNKEFLFMGNPIWNKPFIKDTDTSIFFFSANTLYHNTFDLIEKILENDNELLTVYYDARAEYLEIKTAEVMSEHFPGASIIKGAKWKLDNQEFENDVIVEYDDYVFTIEAKSGRITAPSKRGAINRLEREIKELIQEPYIQSKRLIDEVINRGTLEVHASDGTHYLNWEGKRIIQISVTLEMLGSLSGTPRELIDGELLSSNVLNCINISLTDLISVFNALEYPCQKIHYLQKRVFFQKNFFYKADELDLLQFYLETGFNVDEESMGDNLLVLYGFSRSLDVFFTEYYRGEEPAKPEGHLIDWFSKIFKRYLESQESLNYDIVFRMLDILPRDQKKAEKNVSEVIKDVTVNGMKRNKKYVIFGNKSNSKMLYLVFFVYKEITKQKRNDYATAVYDIIYDIDQSVEDVLIIGIDVDYLDKPYDFVGLLLP